MISHDSFSVQLQRLGWLGNDYEHGEALGEENPQRLYQPALAIIFSKIDFFVVVFWGVHVEFLPPFVLRCDNGFAEMGSLQVGIFLSLRFSFHDLLSPYFRKFDGLSLPSLSVSLCVSSAGYDTKAFYARALSMMILLFAADFVFLDDWNTPFYDATYTGQVVPRPFLGLVFFSRAWRVGVNRGHARARGSDGVQNGQVEEGIAE